MRSPTTLTVVAIGVFILTAALLLGGNVPAQAGVPTETPTPTIDATPTVLQPPAAPTNFRDIQDGFAWDDNSDNEDGFRLRKTVGFRLVPPQAAGPTVFAEVPANTTEAPFPSLTDEEFCAGVDFSIVAFNEAGESAPAEDGRILQTDCFGFAPLTPTPTAVPTVIGPRTGTGSNGEGASSMGLLVAAGGVFALGLGAAAIALSRRRPGAR